MLVQLCHHPLDLCLDLYSSVNPIAEKEYGVEIHTIAADFSNGRQIYDGIARGLEGKDIGILGKSRVAVNR